MTIEITSASGIGEDVPMAPHDLSASHNMQTIKLLTIISMLRFNCNHLSEYLGNSLIVTLFYTQCESRVKNIRIQQHKTSSSNISVDQHVILCSHLLRSLWEDFIVIQYISHLPKNEELCAYNFNLYS